MLALAVYLAIRDAVGRLGGGGLMPVLNAPATPRGYPDGRGRYQATGRSGCKIDD